MFNTVKILSTLFSMALLTACGGDKPKQQGPPPATAVSVSTVQVADAVYYEEFPASVTALNEIELRAQVSGYVTGIFFKDGSKVRKGQRLYAIDAQVYSANVQEATANLQVQETNLAKTQKDAERYHELDKQDAVAKQQVDYADAALEAAKKQVAAARAGVSAVRANVQFANITAPFSGTIGISQVKTGTAVVAGQTILNTVSTDNPIAIDIAVSQDEIYRFIQLQQQPKSAGDSLFTLAFGPEIYPYPGTINLIDRAVDPQTGTIKIRLVFPNDKGMLKPGMNGTLRVKNSDSKNSIVIPYNAVTEQLGEYFVYVPGDSNKVSQRKIVLGNQVDANVIIKKGLKEGEKIVVQGMQGLKEGSVITTTPVQQQSAPAAKK
ncbi:MAG: efflux RND transporter periplasmic adaptor subunit [Chitinophagaceae bacterium]|nr:efflux RND transporter periplasmic adaptor subunit [Chitinophagaceae bacterium]